jgi:hypothetical protein
MLIAIATDNPVSKDRLLFGQQRTPTPDEGFQTAPRACRKPALSRCAAMWSTG